MKKGGLYQNTPYHFVIRSVAKDLGNIHFMYSRFCIMCLYELFHFLIKLH